MRLRRTLLWTNAVEPGKLEASIASNADCLVLDLEDGIVPAMKETARENTARALREKDFRGKEKAVRINGLDTEYGLKDLEAILPAGPNAIRLPKCESVEYVLRADKILGGFEKENGLSPDSIELILMLETAEGVRHAFEMAKCCGRVTAIGIGMEDLTADLGVKRYYELNSLDLLYARQKVVLDGKAAGVQVLDSCALFKDNLEFFREDTVLIKRHGFTGRSVNDISQVDLVNEVFTPTQEELDWSRRVIETYQAACGGTGDGDCRVDGIFIDQAVVDKAEHILNSMERIQKLAKEA